MYLFLLLTLACLSTGAYAVVGTPCAVEDQCDEGECCQILANDLDWATSKKRAAADCDSPMMAGTCQKYTPEGRGCVSYDKMNGYCSCEPGTYCHGYQVPISSGRRSERGLATARPGYEWRSTCDKIVTGR